MRNRVHAVDQLRHRVGGGLLGQREDQTAGFAARRPLPVRVECGQHHHARMQLAAVDRAVTDHLGHEAHVRAGVHLVQEHVGARLRIAFGLARTHLRLGILHDVHHILLHGAAVHIQNDQAHVQPRAQIADEHGLAAAALAHQNHGHTAANAHVDGQHLDEAVTGQTVASVQQAERFVARARHVREAAQNLMVASGQCIQILADVELIGLEEGEQVGMHLVAHQGRVQTEEADRVRHVREEQRLVVALVPGQRVVEHGLQVTEVGQYTALLLGHLDRFLAGGNRRRGTRRRRGRRRLVRGCFRLGHRILDPLGNAAQILKGATLLLDVGRHGAPTVEGLVGAERECTLVGVAHRTHLPAVLACTPEQMATLARRLDVVRATIDVVIGRLQ
mmetsp:Transcript_7709/g.23744  ORF Transcript_7709/g.23744 Transcript_7709/m.23744 type:complete len:390 (-) Transcript_7709:5455-6624(-)